MSKAFAFVKFQKTGNVYYGYYDGTTDVMCPLICTPEECRNENGCCCPISYLGKSDKWRDYDEMRKDLSDLDDIEIYSDYGYGFY